MTQTFSNADDTLLTAEQVAARLGCAVQTIRRAAAAGRLKCVKLSRRMIRYSLADILPAQPPAMPPQRDNDRPQIKSAMLSMTPEKREAR